MMSVGKVLGIALVVGGLLLWVVTVLPPFPKFGLKNYSNESLVASPLPASDDGQVTLEGMVVYDHPNSAHPVPYIAYQLPEGGLRTKQLVFGNQGCSPADGDIPCPPGVVAPATSLPETTRIRVTGVINGDQILVRSMESA